MPKLNYYDDKASNDASMYTRSTDPRTWAWNYPVELKSLGDQVIGADAQVEDGFVKIGIFNKEKNARFLNEKNVLSAIEIQEMPGAMFGLPDVKKVAVIHNVTTIPEQRGKGWARILYEFVLNKYKVLFSDTEIFTDKGKENKTLSIWKNYLPKLGTVLNWNNLNHTYGEFDPVEGTKSEDVRFVVISDKNILQSLTESFSKWMKKGATGAALTGLLSLPMMSMTKSEEKPQPMSPPYPPRMEVPAHYNTYGQSPLAPQPAPQQPQQAEPEQEDNTINVNIIATLESGGNAKVGTNRKGASGLCQLKKAAWDEAAKSLFGKSGHKKYPYAKYASNAYVNKKISDHYYNVVLPKHLDAFDVPITKDTLLASYNWGSNNVKKAMRKYGDNWLRAAPSETKSYIERYHNIEKDL